MSRTLKWIGVVVVALTLLGAGIATLLDANHLRGTIVYLITHKIGRQLAINDDLQWKLDWPQIRLHATDVTFANPPWAREKEMIAAAAVELSVDLPLLVRGTLFLPDVLLDRAVIFFEHSADGRKNWLLDHDQQDEDARLHWLQSTRPNSALLNPSGTAEIVCAVWDLRSVLPSHGLLRLR